MANSSARSVIFSYAARSSSPRSRGAVRAQSGLRRHGGVERGPAVGDAGVGDVRQHPPVDGVVDGEGLAAARRRATARR